jgi:fumarate hydratase class II
VLDEAVQRAIGVVPQWCDEVISGALDDAIADVEHATHGLLEVAMGGTAVGTGLNAPAGFGEQVAVQLAAMTDTPFVTATNKFTAQATLDAMVRAHGGLKAAAVTFVQDRQRPALAGLGPAHRPG